MRIRNTLLLCIASLFINTIHADLINAQENGWGNLKGRIKVSGDVPKLPPLKIVGCPGVANPAPADPNLTVSKDGGLKEVFVMMYLKGDKKPAIHPSYEEMAAKPVTLDNKDCLFSPHALFLRTGQPLTLKNSDNVGHNCHIILLNSEENITIPVADSVDVKFKDTERVPGLVKCDIHRWMDAVLLVRDEPYAAITDKDGSFEIKNIPEGEWKFQFWHKKAGYLRDLNVSDKEVGRRGDIEIEIKNGETLDLGEMTIDGSKLNK